MSRPQKYAYMGNDLNQHLHDSITVIFLFQFSGIQARCFATQNHLHGICLLHNRNTLFTNRSGVLLMQKLRTPLVEAKGYQRFPLFKPGVGI